MKIYRFITPHTNLSVCLFVFMIKSPTGWKKSRNFAFVSIKLRRLLEIVYFSSKILNFFHMIITKNSFVLNKNNIDKKLLFFLYALDCKFQQNFNYSPTFFFDNKHAHCVRNINSKEEKTEQQQQ